MVVGLALLLGGGLPAQAKPAHLQALREHYGTFLPNALRNCQTCHLPSQAKAPASLAEFPHNVFGKRLADAAA